MKSKEKRVMQEVHEVIQDLDRAISNVHDVLAKIDRAFAEGVLQIEEHVISKSIWNDIGMYCLRNGLPELAQIVYREMLNTIERCEKSLDKKLHKGIALHNLGIALYSQSRRKEAKIKFEKAYKEDITTKGKEKANRGLAKIALEKLFAEPVSCTS